MRKVEKLTWRHREWKEHRDQSKSISYRNYLQSDRAFHQLVYVNHYHQGMSLQWDQWRPG